MIDDLFECKGTKNNNANQITYDKFSKLFRHLTFHLDLYYY